MLPRNTPHEKLLISLFMIPKPLYQPKSSSSMTKHFTTPSSRMVKNSVQTKICLKKPN
jgi:hypothetical protein